MGDEIRGTASELMAMAMNDELELDEINEYGDIVEDDNLEDTENETEVEVESETEETSDGEAREDTDETDTEDGDSNTQDIENDVSEDENVTTEDEGEPTGEPEAGESTETTEDSVEKNTEEDNPEPAEVKVENNGVDIEEFNRLKQFYDELTTTKIKVNGRERTGFTDPKDILAAQQKAGGVEKKFKAIKEIQPFVESMQKNGFIENPGMYELAARAVKGDVSALKQIMEDNKIDPLLDFEDTTVDKYTAKNDMVASEGEIAYNEVRDLADNMGVASQFEDVLFNGFDKDSRAEIFKDPATTKAIGAALAEQIENGLYDQVMEQVDVMDLRDPKFASMNSLDKYNAASVVVNQNNAKAIQDKQTQDKVTKEAEAQAKADKLAEAKKVEAEKAKIEKAREEKAYKAKAKEQEDKAAAARSKATQSSKPKPGKKSVSKKSSPLDLPKAEFAQFWKELKELGDD